MLAITVISSLVFLFLRRRRTAAQAQPQPLLSAELPTNTGDSMRKDAQSTPFIHEKAAGGSDEQLHEAPSGVRSRFIELPADYSR